jgi:acetyl esterase
MNYTKQELSLKLRQKEERKLKFLSYLARRALDKYFINTFTQKKLPVSRITPSKLNTPYGDITLYLYYPLVRRQHYPLFFNIHGGGFIVGSAKDDDPLCRLICNTLGAVVLNIDYTLAPEFRYPSQLEQCYSALQWACQRSDELKIDTSRVVIGGHSAGGNLTAALNLLLLTRPLIKPCYQIMLCPLLDLATPPSAKIWADDRSKTIPNRVAQFFPLCYLDEKTSANNPLVSPLYATKSQLNGLPPAIVIGAGNDNLWLEGKKFASHLNDAGVAVLYKRYPHQAHAFVRDENNPQGQQVWELIFNTLTPLFNP